MSRLSKFRATPRMEWHNEDARRYGSARYNGVADRADLHWRGPKHICARRWRPRDRAVSSACITISAGCLDQRLAHVSSARRSLHVCLLIGNRRLRASVLIRLHHLELDSLHEPASVECWLA